VGRASACDKLMSYMVRFCPSLAPVMGPSLSSRRRASRSLHPPWLTWASEIEPFLNISPPGTCFRKRSARGLPTRPWGNTKYCYKGKGGRLGHELRAIMTEIDAS
jgi:hypothetical protein